MNFLCPEAPRYFVEALGVRTGYYMMGRRNGRPILMLHGMSTSGDSFREALHALADDQWLIAPDIPGFGYSDDTFPYTVPHLVEWLAAFREALQLPPLTLVGHSFGGALAAAFALAYPQDVTQLLLVAPSLLSSEMYSSFMKKVGFQLRLIDLGMAFSQSPLWVRRQIKAPFYDPSAQHESVWQRRLLDYKMSRASVDVIRAMAFYSLRERLPQLAQPVHMLWGKEDTVVPPAGAETLLDLLPRASVEFVPACGHALILEQATVFHTAVRQVMNNE